MYFLIWKDIHSSVLNIPYLVCKYLVSNRESRYNKVGEREMIRALGFEQSHM